MSRRRDPYNEDNAPTVVGDIIRKILEKSGKRSIPIQNYRIWEIWDKVVGANIARHAKPANFSHGRLYVAVTHAAWMTELGYRREELKGRINRELGREVVKDIVFRQGQSRRKPNG